MPSIIRRVSIARTREPAATSAGRGQHRLTVDRRGHRAPQRRVRNVPRRHGARTGPDGTGTGHRGRVVHQRDGGPRAFGGAPVPERLPPKPIQKEIVRLARDPGYDVERIHAYRRREYKSLDIGTDTIRAQSGLDRQR